MTIEAEASLFGKRVPFFDRTPNPGSEFEMLGFTWHEMQESLPDFNLRQKLWIYFTAKTVNPHNNVIKVVNPNRLTVYIGRLESKFEKEQITERNFVGTTLIPFIKYRLYWHE